MNARSPYLVSGLGHMVFLAVLLSLSAVQRPPSIVPGVRIVTLPGGSRRGGGGGKEPAEARAVERPAPPAPAVRPEPKPKPVEKAPPQRDRAKPPDPRGSRPPEKQEIVSKTPSRATPQAAEPGAGSSGGPSARTSGTAVAGSGTTPGPAGPGGPGSAQGGVGVEAEGDAGLASGYLVLLRDKVASSWQPPPSVGRLGETRAVVYFVIPRGGGQPQQLVVQSPSGITYFDRSALSAVLGSAPLPPLPAQWPYESIAIKFTFYQQY